LLVKELRTRLECEVFGLAGQRSEEAGVETVVSLDEVSVIGLVEVVSKLPSLHRAMTKLVEEARARQPAAAVLVDFSGFNLRLARRLKADGIPVIYYVSPQVWAWRRGRVRAIRESVDEMLVILPFEKAFYEEHGVRARYVGHPLVDLTGETMDRDRDRDRESFLRGLGLDLAPDRPLVSVLPGSRRKEVELHMPVLRSAIERLARSKPELQFVVSRAQTVSPELLRASLGETLDRFDVRVFTGEVRSALSHSSVAIVASGTATVEAALSETPMVVVYRIGKASYRLGKPFVHVPHYSMVNLIAERALVPELIQDEMTPETIARATMELLDDDAARDAMRRGLREVRERLGGGGASSRAADAVCDFLQKDRAPSLQSSLL
jgi:lipid-A-disaccharide synthase